ncbi:MAG: S9 family peptidase [Planctomycetes bacterium]|nr:S9 family peptidase [Planctomycetota bacterium]MCB9887653.1 S9 family peptidase [Planctomycetota bacterium]
MPPQEKAEADPNLWLEDVTGDKALAWVRARNAASVSALAENDTFRELQGKILSILDSTARIPYVARRGAHYWNFWQDAKNPRGLWRRTTLAEYEKDEPQWEVVLDLDALGKEEGENWVWKGASFLMPDRTRCLLSLSRGGADAAVVREFDVTTKRFVEDGFVLPEAKSMTSWRDRDSIYVATDFGPGSMTESGYPRIARLWRRGTPLSSAETVAEGSAQDVYLTAMRDQTKGWERDFVYRATTFFTNEMFLLQDGRKVRIDKPDSANANVYHDWLLLELRDDWQVAGTTHPAGSLLACKLDAFLAGTRTFDVLFAPTDRTSLAGFSPTKNHILVNVLDNVKNRIFVLTHEDGGWRRDTLPGLPEFGTISASAVDDEEGDDYWLTITDYLTPTSLWLGTIGGGPARQLKSLPAFFDADGLMVEQREAKSKDGTRVPYFVVHGKDIARDGSNPTLLYGYGGFEVSMTPGYSATAGACWLTKGGVYAIANIRGGGEFGPKWHQAALKQNRNKAYEDFAAVAEDLVAQKLTSKAHLGIQGGSNGGLLMGNMLTMYPQLFGAVVIQVPLLDMLRYHKLLAGASWMGEYGDPDVPEEAVWLRRYSPYHNLDPKAAYPKVLLTTSTRDDRVHPGHARKFMARLVEQGHDALYYENIEGGHGGAADNKQAAFMAALAYTFLWQQLR